MIRFWDAGDVTVTWPQASTSRHALVGTDSRPAAWTGAPTVVGTRECGVCRRRRRAGR
ncbi:hypothetical protein AB0O07_28725 [Streptomyces sp. NPDC093085]|uniref:hypothetical protein n=1 Tax=Streptomyces sp. NPDC093085 TaxID=3155068 RepID=UPI00344A648A